MENAMTTKKAEVTADPAPLKSATDVIATDEFAGKGGSYIFDPTTGTRSPAPQTPEQPEEE